MIQSVSIYLTTVLLAAAAHVVRWPRYVPVTIDCSCYERVVRAAIAKVVVAVVTALQADDRVA